MPDCTRCGFAGHGLYFMGDGPLCRDCFANDYADARRRAELDQVDHEFGIGWLDEEEANDAKEALGFDSDTYAKMLDEGYVEADSLAA